MSLILFLIAIILVVGLGVIALPFTFVYYIVTLKWKSGFKAFEKWVLKLAISLDQLGNVICAVPFQYLFTKNGYKFGDVDMTVSFVIAMNREQDTLTRLGKALAWLLDFLDKDHCQKSIDKQRENDLKACERCQQD